MTLSLCPVLRRREGRPPHEGRVRRAEGAQQEAKVGQEVKVKAEQAFPPGKDRQIMRINATVSRDTEADNCFIVQSITCVFVAAAAQCAAFLALLIQLFLLR